MMRPMEPAKRLYTASEYLAREVAREGRHEFVDGVEYAMAGASPAHTDLVVRLLAEVFPTLRARGCNARMLDQRVRPGTRFYYPDLVMYCGSPSYLEDGFGTITDAPVIIEVLSPTTEAHDRGDKFNDYQLMPSFREYLLVDARRARIQQFIRQDDGSWRMLTHGPGATFAIEAVGVTIAVDHVYDGVILDSSVRLA